MKKIFIIITIGFSISLLISCFSTEHYLIKEVKFYGVELTNPDVSNYEDKDFIKVSDTLSHRLFFRVFGETEYQYGYLNNTPLINSCYATSVPQALDNFIIIDSLQVKLNSDIYFENDTIKANTDLWNHPMLKDYKWYFNESTQHDLVYSFTFGFIDSFYDKIRIPNKEYEIELTCKTNDGLTFIEQIDLYLEMENE